MSNLQEILDKLDRWYAGIDGADDDYLDPEEAQAAIAELVEECLPDIKVGTKNLPLNDLERGYNVAVEDIRNNLIKVGVLNG